MGYQREYARRMKLGVIGTGSHTYRNILPALNYLPVELKAVCNFSNETVGNLTAIQYGCHYYKGTEQMYREEDLDAVFIVTSPASQADLTIEALDHNMHVFVEKPIAMNCAELEEVIKHQKDRVVLTGYKKAFMPAMEKVKEMSSSEKYGNLKSIMAVYPIQYPDHPDEALQNKIVNDWLKNSCHPFSILVEAAGKPVRVQSICGARGGCVCIVEFENGVIATLHASDKRTLIENYGFYGNAWIIQIDNTSKVTLNRGIPFDYDTSDTFVPMGEDTGSVVWEVSNCRGTLENKALFKQGMYFEMKAFCDAVLDGKPVTTGSLEFSMYVTKLFEGSLKSRGKIIDL